MKTSLITGIACLALSTTFLSSCKKEEIKANKPVIQTENQDPEIPQDKFSTTIKIPGESAENGFVMLKVTSDDEVYLNKYVAKLEQTKITMEEITSIESKQEDRNPMLEEESTSSVGLFFDFTDFKFDRQKGKMYDFKLQDKVQNKSTVFFYSLTNVHQFNIGGTVAVASIYSVYRYWDPSCLCYKNSNNCKWTLSNPLGQFYTESPMSYHQNLDIRCFRMPNNGYANFPYFMMNGDKVYYRRGINYTGPSMPAGYIDTDAISSGFGSSLLDPFMPSYADLSFYIVG